MVNPFVQHIGIWYAKEDELMMMRIMDQISDWCSRYIEKKIFGQHERCIYLKDGTWIRALPIVEGMRAQRCTSSFIINPEHIQKKYIDTVIYPITIRGGRDVFVIDSSDEEELLYRLWDKMSYDEWHTIYCGNAE